MSNVEQLQEQAREQSDAAMQQAKAQSDAAMASGNQVAASVQAITAAYSEYTRKAIQDGADFMAKLASIKTPSDAMVLQSEYAKTAYAEFMAEAKKISGLYADLAKQAYKPLGRMGSK
jgi:phasin family protein